MTRAEATGMPKAALRLGRSLEGLDPWLAAPTVGLVGLGAVMVYSASAIRAGGADLLVRHLVAVLLGAGAGVAALTMPLDRWRRWALVAAVITVVLLVAVFVPGVGRRVNGAARWISAGPLSFQPAELAKLTWVLFLARLLAHPRERAFRDAFVPSAAALGGLAALLLMQPDLGTVGVLGATWVAMLFVAGVQLELLVGSFALAVPVVWHYVATHEHAARRIRAFWDPEAHRADVGYQVWESLVAFGSGGPWGLGLGRGDHKLYYLPESHTDFVFSVVGQELGFVGVVVVLGAYGLLLTRVFATSRQMPTRFGRLFVLGIGVWLAVQVVVHVGVTMALLPAKGLTLPLVSFGRSSLVVTLLAIGVVLRAGSEVYGGQAGRGRAKG
jgi:cell division protein FtsW